MATRNAASLLSEAAPAFGIHVAELRRDGFRAAVPVLMADQSIERYDLAVTGLGDRASVGEAVSARLPVFCPVRHINADSSFCLAWEAVESLAVRNLGEAETWWGVVLQFLRLQKRAARLRRWPDRRQWAHGAAAVHHRSAREAAAAISPRLLEQLDRSRVGVKRSRGHSAEGPAFRLTVDGRPLVRVFVDRRRPATTRRACPCGRAGRPLTLRECRDHAARFVDLVQALRDMELEEATFWRSFETRTCCGTMDDCPLAVTVRTETSNGVTKLGGTAG